MSVLADRPGQAQGAPIVQPGVTMRSLSEEVAGRVLRPQMPLWWWIGFGIGLALLAVLIVAVTWLFVFGIGVWGVDIPVAWGLAIAEYVWWIALASGGTVVSALFYLTRSPWRAATNRIAETMLLAAAACAGLMPILHLGRPGFFYWLFSYQNVMNLWPQPRSPLWWDFVCLICYILMSLMFFYVGLLPDLATLRDLATTRGRQVFYGILALGWRGSARHWQHHRMVYGIMAAIMAPMVVSVHSVVGLDFAGGLTPGWHSTEFPPYFFFGAVISGTALVIILTVLVRRGFRLQSVITEYHLNALGKLMLVGSVMLTYAYVWEAFGPFYGSDIAERTQFVDAISGLYAPLYWGKIALNAVIPQLLWLPAVRRSELMLVLIASAIIIGMWLERFVIVIPSLHRDYMPAMWGDYAPTFWDWALLAGSVGLFLTLFFLMLRLLPIVAMAETREIVERGPR